jgi:hypothetical protein
MRKSSKTKYGVPDYDNRSKRSLNALLLPDDLMRRIQWYRAVNAVKMTTSWNRSQERTEMWIIALVLDTDDVLQNVKTVSRGLAESIARQLRKLRCSVRVVPRTRRVGKNRRLFTLRLLVTQLDRVRRDEVVVAHLRLSDQVRKRGGMYNQNAPRLRRPGQL